MDPDYLPTQANSTGYRRLADFMAWDRPAAIFHRFRSANALNLLILQTRVSRAQEELLALTETSQASSSKGLGGRVGFDWAALEAGDGPNKQVIENKLKAFQENLRAYNDALLQQNAVNALTSPARIDLEQLQNWLQDIYHGASELQGPGSDIWFVPEGSEEDFVSVWPRSRVTDWFTKSLIRSFPLIHRVWPRIPLKRRSFPARMPAWLNIAKAQEDSKEQTSAVAPTVPAEKNFELLSSTGAIVGTADVIITVICCLLLTVPTIVLSFIEPLPWKLFVIVVSTLAFALSLSLFSDAARKDIFGVTAAFVAVQVVFLGTNSNSG